MSPSPAQPLTLFDGGHSYGRVGTVDEPAAVLETVLRDASRPGWEVTHGAHVGTSQGYLVRAKAIGGDWVVVAEHGTVSEAVETFVALEAVTRCRDATELLKRVQEALEAAEDDVQSVEGAWVGPESRETAA